MVCIHEEKFNTFDRVEFVQSKFMGEPWLYFKCYHKDKAVIFDVSMKSYYKIGVPVDSVKKEWCRVWGEW